MNYAGDLEADYIGFLVKSQNAAKENPTDVEFDFPYVADRLNRGSTLDLFPSHIGPN
jgi:hypothetical protein